MFGYIYKTTNLVNDKIYIGQHHGDIDLHYHGSGKLIRYAIKKYGVQYFKTEVLEECNCDAMLNEREVFWIKYYNSTDKSIGYNIHKGGISSPLAGKVSHRKGKKLSIQSRIKMSIADTGGKKSPEHCENIRKALLGNKIPESVKRKISKSVKLNSASRGTIWIKNPITYESKKLLPSDAEYYLKLGWVRGRYKTKNSC